MVLCEICRSIDFRSLFVARLKQCRARQKAYHGNTDGIRYKPDDLPSIKAKHYDDIFELEKSARDCDLCSLIFQGFERRGDVDAEDASPIFFHSLETKIEVWGGDWKLCGLDVYTDRANTKEILEMCKMEEDDSPPILRMMSKHPDSKEAMTIASSWLRNCLKNHSSCNPPPESQIPPKRLINVGNETQCPFLVETSSASRHIQWLSLSYCWGQDPSMKLTRKTMDMLKNGIALDRFDPTIRDAILVARGLEIPYIWIDSLCIVQKEDGEEDGEWNKEASKMNEIYGGSTVTLVVASSSSVMEGFLKERQSQYVSISMPDTPGGEPSDTTSRWNAYLSLEWDENEDSAKGPWDRRGWTMQEGLLPNRLLCYTSSQSIWKCCKEERFERGVTKNPEHYVARGQRLFDDMSFGSFGSGWLWEQETFIKFKRFRDYLPSPPSPGRSLRLEREVFRLWYDLIEDYSPREFTNIQDRLVAFSGLAKVYGNIIQCNDDDYVAGLWKPDLIRGLLWHTDGARLVPRRSPKSMLAVNPEFPSWSWASVGYEVVKNHHKDNDSFDFISEVEDIQIDHRDQGQPFGAVQSDSLVLTGPLKKLPRLYNMAWKSADVSMSEFERRLSQIVEMESRGDVEPKYSSPPPGGHFAALQMLRGFGGQPMSSLDLLILEATNGINTYRRVGILTLRSAPEGMSASRIVVDLVKDLENSLPARIGPSRTTAETIEFYNKVMEELEGDDWLRESVTIV
ncbi:HET-domain-containing protein [Coniochaeta ligniaria NRRL 30616]|uniref:HET-domain-containing protein n=1 Tax=Coniochaeta ligniaria NRRL 30616 TaxID=1408157 RepID=A0A1J7IAH1_9PEZI|nr:HET-domain-containing protein [Coniochaeta ligniaria NRRL 30616]